MSGQKASSGAGDCEGEWTPVYIPRLARIYTFKPLILTILPKPAVESGGAALPHQADVRLLLSSVRHFITDYFTGISRS